MRPLPDVPDPLRRQIAALADLAARALASGSPDGGRLAGRRASSVIGLLEGLLEQFLVARAVRRARSRSRRACCWAPTPTPRTRAASNTGDDACLVAVHVR